MRYFVVVSYVAFPSAAWFNFKVNFPVFRIISHGLMVQSEVCILRSSVLGLAIRVLSIIQRPIRLIAFVHNKFYFSQKIEGTYTFLSYPIAGSYCVSRYWIGLYTSHPSGISFEFFSLLLWDTEFTRKVCYDFIGSLEKFGYFTIYLILWT